MLFLLVALLAHEIIRLLRLPPTKLIRLNRCLSFSFYFSNNLFPLKFSPYFNFVECTLRSLLFGCYESATSRLDAKQANLLALLSHTHPPKSVINDVIEFQSAEFLPPEVVGLCSELRFFTAFRSGVPVGQSHFTMP